MVVSMLFFKGPSTATTKTKGSASLVFYHDSTSPDHTPITKET